MAKEYDGALALAKELVKNLRDLIEALDRDQNKGAVADLGETMDRIQRLLSDRFDIKKS
ncbi:MAG TPA: hypothetical protein VHV54_20585 [Candidatus Binatia bacterium]|nr:hypothetical protein [Candidatus Binatia bacterium]